jgi:hypothetical protein
MHLTVTLALVALTQSGNNTLMDESWFLKVVGNPTYAQASMIQKEQLKLTAYQVDKIASLRSLVDALREERAPEFRKKTEDLKKAGQAEQVGAYRRDLSREMDKTWDAHLLNILTQEQYIRYKQLSVRSRGISGLMEKEIVELLKIDAEQTRKFNGIWQRLKAEEAVVYKEYQDAVVDKNRDKRIERIMKTNELEAKALKDCENLLTDDQRRSWRIILGPTKDEYKAMRNSQP